MTRKQFRLLGMSTIVILLGAMAIFSPNDQVGSWSIIALVFALAIYLRMVLTIGMYDFRSRGIGSRDDINCFVCGTNDRDGHGSKMLHNISAFVNNREEGMLIVGMFDQGALLDHRSSEPETPQVKVGACDMHYNNLVQLDKATRRNSVISARIVSRALDLEKKGELT